MVRPSNHLIEYIENQNIEISDIIKNLPSEMTVKVDEVDLESAMNEQINNPKPIENNNPQPKVVENKNPQQPVENKPVQSQQHVVQKPIPPRPQGQMVQRRIVQRQVVQRPTVQRQVVQPINQNPQQPKPTEQ